MDWFVLAQTEDLEVALQDEIQKREKILQRTSWFVHLLNHRN